MKANTKKTGNTIVLTEGLETFNLLFEDRNEVVAISFNPADTDFIVRAAQSKENIEKALSGISTETDAETLKQINEVCYKEVDFVFGSKISDKVFKNCSPIALNAKGEMFIERFIDAVIPYVQDRIIAARKASEARISKYTDKYTK